MQGWGVPRICEGPEEFRAATRDEIKRGETDVNHRLKLSDPKVRVPESKRKGPRYTPLSKRQDRPNAILWLVRNHPELKDAAISRLVGTTKSTIEQIRDRKHWNAANLVPMDPVTLGLCSQIDLDIEVQRASSSKAPAAPVGHLLWFLSRIVGTEEVVVPMVDSPPRTSEEEAPR
jgi:hypothetical protein